MQQINPSLLNQALTGHQESVAIVGLGYVGLPLGCLLATKFKVVGYDIDQGRVDELRRGIDRTNEIHDLTSLKNPNISFTTHIQDIKKCKIFIITVPTPVDNFRIPDLSPLRNASKAVGQIMQAGSIVVYESTVYPGVTEGPCATELEKTSGLKSGLDFFLGYSPERINPGDRKNTIDKIKKIISAQNPQILAVMRHVYGSVITGGLHEASNIKTAEAAKVIENTQRDVNIAIINEFAMLFDSVGLDTKEVLAAAATKWNFLDFKPGLVGGHCIGVDPYYLTHLADSLNFHTELIDAARRTNDLMASYIAKKTVQLLLSNPHTKISGKLKVGILGLTYKEDVPDLRNTKVTDINSGLIGFGVQTLLHDPIADKHFIEEEYHQPASSLEEYKECDALILAVPHKEYMKMGVEQLTKLLKPNGVLIDVKGVLDRNQLADKNITVWRL